MKSGQAFCDDTVAHYGKRLRPLPLMQGTCVGRLMAVTYQVVGRQAQATAAAKHKNTHTTHTPVEVVVVLVPLQKLALDQVLNALLDETKVWCKHAVELLHHLHDQLLVRQLLWERKQWTGKHPKMC